MDVPTGGQTDGTTKQGVDLRVRLKTMSNGLNRGVNGR